MFTFPFSRNSSLVGLDIQSDSMSLLKLKKVRQSWQEEAMVSIDLPPGMIYDGKILAFEPLKSILAALVAQTKTQGNPTAIALSSRQVLKREITLPKFSREEEYTAEIDMYFEKYCPGVTGKMCFDYQLLNKHAHSQQAFLVAVKSEIVEAYLDLIHQSGLVVKVIDVDCYAAARAIFSYANQNNKMVGVVDVGSDIIKIFIFNNQSVFHAQYIVVSSGQNIAADIHDAFQIGYSLNQIDCIYLSGKNAILTQLRDEIFGLLKIKVDIVDRESFFLKLPINFKQPLLCPSLISVGLAIRAPL